MSNVENLEAVRLARTNALALPHNMEAEQALLGCLMYDNAAYEGLSDGLTPEHFYEPFHSSLFRSIGSNIRKGQLAEPILLADEFKRDPAFEQMGGLRYLADLVDRAPPSNNAADYGRVILDLGVRRLAIAIMGEGLDALKDMGEVTARERIEEIETNLYALAETKTSAGFQSFGHFLNAAIESAAEAYSRDGGLSGLSTGLRDLDKKLGGLHKSDLIILAGRPSMGKTALATNIAFHVAKTYAWQPQPDGSRKTIAGGQVAFFSLEMSGEQLANRILSEVAGVSSEKIRTGQITPVEFSFIRDAAIQINEAPLWIDPTGAINIGKLAARARRMKRQRGLDLIVVDYLQLLTGARRYTGSDRTAEVSEVSAGLKALAKELDVPVLALSQLSRQVENREDKRPQLSDLRESGAIEQDADVVAFVYREGYYLSRTEPKETSPEHLAWQQQMDDAAGVAEVIIGKQRHGPIGTVQLHFEGETTKFSNLARERDFVQSTRLPYGEDA